MKSALRAIVVGCCRWFESIGLLVLLMLALGACGSAGGGGGSGAAGDGGSSDGGSSAGGAMSGAAGHSGNPSVGGGSDEMAGMPEQGDDAGAANGGETGSDAGNGGNVSHAGANNGGSANGGAAGSANGGAAGSAGGSSPPPIYTIGGRVTGLASGKTLVLHNGTDDLALTQNGDFTFATAIASGTGYTVTVKTQPLGELCTVSDGSGTVSNANVMTVGIDCVAESFSVGGLVSGLGQNKTLVLRNNGGNDLSLTQNGSFTFTAPIVSGGSYAVSVAAQPSGQICSVSNGGGNVLADAISNVSVTCSNNSYSLGGTLLGLPSGKSVALQLNGGSPLVLNGNGQFTFTTAVADGAGYTVVVSTQPIGMTCSVNGGTGTVNGANVTTVAVNCSTNAYTVGGVVSGLAAGKALVLRDNGGDDLTLTSNGIYAFATPITSGSNYTVTLQTAPKGQTCNVVNAGGTVGTSNVTTVNVFCSDLPYTVGGNISGLTGGQLLLNINGGVNFGFSQNGAFTIPGTLSDGQSYTVAVAAQPAGQLCSLTHATGTIDAANVTNVTATCAPAYLVTAVVQTLAAGQTLVLQNNGGDNLTVNGPVSNNNATFSTKVLDGATFNVTILTQPSGQTCKVTNPTGTVTGANASGPVVTCSQLTISIAAPSLANATRVSAYLFSGSALVAGRQNISLDASGGASFLLSTASSTLSSVTADNTFSPAALLNGAYSVLVSIDKSNNGLLAANADDWNYFSAVTIAGPTTLSLTAASFKSYLNFGLTFSGQTALANMNYFCAAHLPGGDVFTDFAQRTLFGVANGTVNASGTGSLVSGVIAQGTFDFSCLADNANASSGAVELQPYSLSTGKGVDSGFDYVASQSQVAVQAAGSAAVSGFALANFNTGSTACSGSYTSGGNGTAGTGSFNGNNNSALLTGSAPSGCVAGTATGVHKTATVQTVSGSGASHYSYGSAYLTNRTGTSFTMIIPLTNTSGSAKAGIGVAFNGVTFLDATSTTIGVSVAAKIAGSSCVSGSSTMSTCLGAGELGYLLVSGSGYPTVSSVNFTISDNSTVSGMNAKVIPQTFTRYSDGELRIRATNSGLGNGDLSTLSTSNFSFVVTFDQNDTPTDWTTLSTGFADHVFAGNHIAGTSAPKNSLVLVHLANGAPLDISSPKIKVFLSFGDTTTVAN